MSAIAMKPFLGLIIIRFPFGHIWPSPFWGYTDTFRHTHINNKWRSFSIAKLSWQPGFLFACLPDDVATFPQFLGLVPRFPFFLPKFIPDSEKLRFFPKNKKLETCHHHQNLPWKFPHHFPMTFPWLSHDVPIIFPYYPYFPMIFPRFLSHLSPSPGWGLVLWSLGSFLQRGRGLPAGPLGLLGLSEGLSYLAVPWRGWKPWWSWHTTCIPSGNLT